MLYTPAVLVTIQVVETGRAARKAQRQRVVLLATAVNSIHTEQQWSTMNPSFVRSCWADDACNERHDASGHSGNAYSVGSTYYCEHQDVTAASIFIILITIVVD